MDPGVRCTGYHRGCYRYWDTYYDVCRPYPNRFFSLRRVPTGPIRGDPREGFGLRGGEGEGSARRHRDRSGRYRSRVPPRRAPACGGTRSPTFINVYKPKSAWSRRYYCPIRPSAVNWSDHVKTDVLRSTGKHGVYREYNSNYNNNNDSVAESVTIFGSPTGLMTTFAYNNMQIVSDRRLICDSADSDSQLVHAFDLFSCTATIALRLLFLSPSFVIVSTSFSTRFDNTIVLIYIFWLNSISCTCLQYAILILLHLP
jgi:hypothetical protein